MTTPAEWVSESGLLCRAERNVELGVFCGYVALPPSHPWHGRLYTECAWGCPSYPEPGWAHCLHDSIAEVVDVHGGVTFSEAFEGGWWIGFDCGHWCDTVPFPAFMYFGEGHDLTFDEVRAETERMATQVAAVR